jgi:hypothetical protein
MRFAFAILAIGLAMQPTANAQSQNWREYRPDGAGFRIEMPDQPLLKTQDVNGRQAYSAVVGIRKSVAGADLVFLVKYVEASERSGAESEAALDAAVRAMAEGDKLLDVKTEMLGGYPARRFSIEDADKGASEIRSVITDRYFIQAFFLGPVGDPFGKRFLDSFAVVGP